MINYPLPKQKLGCSHTMSYFIGFYEKEMVLPLLCRGQLYLSQLWSVKSGVFPLLGTQTVCRHWSTVRNRPMFSEPPRESVEIILKSCLDSSPLNCSRLFQPSWRSVSLAKLRAIQDLSVSWQPLNAIPRFISDVLHATVCFLTDICPFLVCPLIVM